MKKNIKKMGFTLIELLVVIAIIGLLTTLAIVSLNNARKRAEDVKRIADIKSVQTGLELYFNDNKRYPPAAGNPATASLLYSPGCLGTAGFVGIGDLRYAGCIGDVKSYIKILPNDKTGYQYIYQTNIAGSSYGLYFKIDATIEQLPWGIWWATPKGFKPATSSRLPTEWQ